MLIGSPAKSEHVTHCDKMYHIAIRGAIPTSSWDGAVEREVGGYPEIVSTGLMGRSD